MPGTVVVPSGMVTSTWSPRRTAGPPTVSQTWTPGVSEVPDSTLAPAWTAAPSWLRDRGDPQRTGQERDLTERDRPGDGHAAGLLPALDGRLGGPAELRRRRVLDRSRGRRGCAAAAGRRARRSCRARTPARRGASRTASVTGWPATPNSGCPRRTTSPAAGSQLRIPPSELAGHGEKTLVTERAWHLLRGGQVGAHHRGGRHGNGRRHDRAGEPPPPQPVGREAGRGGDRQRPPPAPGHRAAERAAGRSSGLLPGVPAGDAGRARRVVNWPRGHRCPPLGHRRWQAVAARQVGRGSSVCSDGGSGNEPSGSGSGQFGTPCCRRHSASRTSAWNCACGTGGEALPDGNRCWQAWRVLAGALPGETAKCHRPSLGS